MDPIVFENPSGWNAFKIEVTDDGFIYIFVNQYGIIAGDIRDP